MTFDDAPEMLRVEEAAKLLRISLSAVYEGVAGFQTTNGFEGIPFDVDRVVAADAEGRAARLDQREGAPRRCRRPRRCGLTRRSSS